MRNSFLSILSHKDFKRIWLSQVFSQISLNIITFALILHIYDLTGRATSISFVMISAALAVVVFGPFSGVLADKVDCRKILIYTNLLRFLAVVLLMISANNMLAILGVIFIINALAQIFTPAESAAFPMILKKSELVAANSIAMTATYATLLIGYCAAGPLLNFIGPFWLFFACALLFVIAAWETYLLSDFDKKTPRKITLTSFATAFEKVWEETKVGLQYLKQTKNVFNPMIKLTIGWAIFGAFITILPSYVSDVLNRNPKLVGSLIIAPAGIGMILAASWLNNKRKEANIKLLNDAFIAVGISLMVFALYPMYDFSYIAWPILIISIIFMGAGSSLVQISAQTLLHINSDEDKRGRVFGISTMQLRLAMAVPALFIGGLTDLTSAFFTIFLLALLTLGYGIFLVFEQAVA